jgi:hypothetical protein
LASRHSPVLEQGAERQSDLPVLIAFGAGRERAGISQNIAPVLNKFRVAIERMIWRLCASNRRHDATYLDTPSPKWVTDSICDSAFLSRWSLSLTSRI